MNNRRKSHLFLKRIDRQTDPGNCKNGQPHLCTMKKILPEAMLMCMKIRDED